jgi:transcription initiation factor TFIID subunit TAF12
LTFWQIDPSEKLEADVEDSLIEIAEDFVESVSHGHILSLSVF